MTDPYSWDGAPEGAQFRDIQGNRWYKFIRDEVWAHKGEPGNKWYESSFEQNQLSRKTERFKPRSAPRVPNCDETRAAWIKKFGSTDTKQNPEEVPAMSTAKAFETRHFVFGVDTAGMSEDQLIEAIRKLEAEITSLQQVKTASKKIAARIEELTAMLASVVGVLDGE